MDITGILHIKAVIFIKSAR